MQRKNKGLVITIIVLIILLLGTSSYIVYDKFFATNLSKNVVNENDDKNENNNDLVDETEENESLSQAELENLGHKLYDIVSKKGTYDTYLFGIKEKLTYDELDDAYKYNLVFHNIPFAEKTYIEDCEYECVKEIVSNEVFAKYYHLIFGSDKDIKYEDFHFYYSVYECINNGSKYYCKQNNGSDVNPTKQYIDYDRTEQNGDEIYVYVKSLDVYNSDDEYGGIYKDYFNNYKLDDITFYENIVHDYYTYEEKKYFLFGKYGDDAKEYKVTFKKENNSDNYYWYSVEAI